MLRDPLAVLSAGMLLYVGVERTIMCILELLHGIPCMLKAYAVHIPFPKDTKLMHERSFKQ